MLPSNGKNTTSTKQHISINLLKSKIPLKPCQDPEIEHACMNQLFNFQKRKKNRSGSNPSVKPIFLYNDMHSEKYTQCVMT